AGKGLAVIEISIPFSNEEHVYRREHDHLESASSQSRMFSGRAAHSSDPKGGDNAIMKMLEYLSQLPEGIAVLDLDGGIGYNTIPAKAVLEIDTVAGFKDPILPKISRLYSSLRALEQELLNFREDGFSPAHPTINMGTIRTFENEVRITGSVRLPPSVTDVIYEGWMRGLESAVGDVGATFRVKDYRKGFSTLPEAEFVTEAGRLLSGLGYEGMPVKSTSASEASVFSRHGIDCLLFGPGMSVGNSHAPNECVKISELRAATDFYRKALERFST
ncbi:MAG TPA: M20/M25/M40 family metallo-hydrolase, partial [Bdellovibrionales bacterium]|nr:M20/M25/M40 family metallo-hydrolase [Bdellovibrionales bacterium]